MAMTFAYEWRYTAMVTFSLLVITFIANLTFVKTYFYANFFFIKARFYRNLVFITILLGSFR